MLNHQVDPNDSNSNLDLQINVDKGSALNYLLALKFHNLSIQVDKIPHDLSFEPIMKYKRRKNGQLTGIEYRDLFKNLVEESNRIKEMRDQTLTQNSTFNNKPISKYNGIGFNVTELIFGNKMKHNLNNRISLLNEWKLNGIELTPNYTKQLGETHGISNKETFMDSLDSYNSSFTGLQSKVSGIESIIYKTKNVPVEYNTEGSESETKRFESIKSQDKKSKTLKKSLLKGLEKLSKNKICTSSSLRRSMSKTNTDKFTNHREFYKIHYMGLLEKYNQARRAYATTLPRMQMLEIQNNILFDIIGKLHPEDDKITNMLREFIEMKSFCIHSIMKLKVELGDNYRNILDLIVNSNSTSEVRPWAKILSGMFNYYDIRVDDMLIQNLNTLYSINRMTQGN